MGYVGQGKWLAEVGIVNSGGGNARPNISELNNFKDVFGTLEWVFDENGSGIGFYGYSGKFLVADTPAWEDKFDRYGVFANYTTPQFTVSGGALTGKHDLAPPAGGTRRVRTYYTELGYSFSKKFLAWARYEHFYRDLTGTPANRLVGLSVGVSYRLNNLGRCVIEYQNQKRTGASDRNLIMAELNWLL